MMGHLATAVILVLSRNHLYPHEVMIPLGILRDIYPSINDECRRLRSNWTSQRTARRHYRVALSVFGFSEEYAEGFILSTEAQ